MGSVYRTMTDVFQSKEWDKISAQYLETHELCELCLLEQNYLLATNVCLKLPPWKITDERLFETSNLIAVCKMHRRQLTRKSNRRYNFDQDGNVIREKVSRS